jgi:hypothetical protein
MIGILRHGSFLVALDDPERNGDKIQKKPMKNTKRKILGNHNTAGTAMQENAGKLIKNFSHTQIIQENLH